MSRNKENNPFSTNQRNSHVATLTRQIPSDDFFTDSLIDASLIPSPISHKASPAKPRRALGVSKALQTAKDTGNKAKGTSLSEYTASRTNNSLKLAPSLSRKKSTSSLRTNGLSTPPRQSTQEHNVNSPTEFSSPPGGLNESYQRIADEEDLAATEREVDSEEEDIEGEQQDTFDVDAAFNPTQDVGDTGSSIHALPVSAPTSDPENVDTERETNVEGFVDNLSAPATLDFLQNEMTDRVLAAKLTPHVVDRAKDRARLERLRQSRIPIDFQNSPKSQEYDPSGSHRRSDIANIASRGPITFDNVLGVGANGVPKAYSDTSAESSPQHKLKAFSRATRAPSNQDAGVAEGSDAPSDVQGKERVVAFSKATNRKNQNSEDLDTQESPAPRVVAFSRANGRSRPYGATYEPEEDHRHPEGQFTESLASTTSDPLPGSTPRSDRNIQAATNFLAKWRKETAERRSPKSQEPGGHDSQVDWAAAAADVPLPSIEESSTPRETPPRSTLSSSLQKQRSNERVRRWENDFTGLSFQVSESPPVRSRSNLNESLREKEIEDLAKQALTTNRLDEIREKDPNVLVRKSSRSFSPEERRQPVADIQGTPTSGKSVGEENFGQSLADTPGLIYKSTNNSTGKLKSSPESQNSLDHLQRLARAVSTTPKQSPVSQETARDEKEDSEVREFNMATSMEDDKKPGSSQGGHNSIPSANDKVTATPKVVGAWTDTILPETVKTAKQPQRVPNYMQTPHVNAGAWIDTPLVNGNRLASAPIPLIIEEVTEELTNGDIVEKDEVEDPQEELQQAEVAKEDPVATEIEPVAQGQIILPPSALTNVLNEAKQKRLMSRDITDVREDTLNLGDATIQSFEELLTDAADITADLTNLIKTGAEEEFMRQRLAECEGDEDSTTAEVAFLGHLTSRMERLMSSLHEARKGISRLEQKVSHAPLLEEQRPEEQAVIALPGPNQLCVVCGGKDDPRLHQHAINTNSLFPISYSTFTLPIPLLFYPRRRDQGQILPRPTWLGWLTLALWTWYIAECTMCELYARPVYAERYAWPVAPEPEFPFVLPTMLWRWSHADTLAPGLLGTAWRLAVAVYRVIGMALGLLDGFVDDVRSGVVGRVGGTGGGGIAEATKSALHAAKSLVPGLAGDDDSMMNDEFI